MLIALAILIPLLPLAACLGTAAVPLVPRLREPALRARLVPWPCVLATGASCVLAIVVLIALLRGMRGEGEASAGPLETYTWAALPGLDIGIDFQADTLTAVMLVTVTLVGTLVAVFSTGYMAGDAGYWRFFALVALFVFSMTMLVSAANFLMLYIFWEAVGLCSYLLIGFWYERPPAASAGMKAFVVNRVGDFGFALGIFLIWRTFGTLDFAVVLDPAAIAEAAHDSPGTITGICLLLFLGAVGKSAQFPLHVWLPDAMEGPTPVSALIHAATMVTAGVYMVARATPLFAAAPEAQVVVATVGCFTALLAALIALTQTDLKRVLAYSTISQLGYMFLGLGAGGFGIVAAMFHLFTHAFFKALLFLAAGSVMHAMGGVIDMRRFGGLRRRLPWTAATFAIGGLALAGFPFVTSGFWSKDEILAAARHGLAGYETYFLVLYAVATLTALLTAFYTFRAFFMTFWGDERLPAEADEHHMHEPAVMTWPLVALAAGAVVLGPLLGPTAVFHGVLAETTTLPPAEATHAIDWLTVAISSAVALVGIGIAYWFYGTPRSPVAALTERLGGLYRLSRDKFYFDEIYAAAIVFPLRALAQVARFLDWILIDGLVNFVGRLPGIVGRWFVRPLHTGLIQWYALVMLIGAATLLFALTLLRELR